MPSFFFACARRVAQKQPLGCPRDPSLAARHTPHGGIRCAGSASAHVGLPSHCVPGSVLVCARGEARVSGGRPHVLWGRVGWRSSPLRAHIARDANGRTHTECGGTQGCWLLLVLVSWAHRPLSCKRTARWPWRPATPSSHCPAAHCPAAYPSAECPCCVRRHGRS